VDFQWLAIGATVGEAGRVAQHVAHGDELQAWLIDRPGTMASAMNLGMRSRPAISTPAAVLSIHAHERSEYLLGSYYPGELFLDIAVSASEVPTPSSPPKKEMAVPATVTQKPYSI